MVAHMSSILDRIVAYKREEIIASRARISDKQLEDEISKGLAPPARDFRFALRLLRQNSTFTAVAVLALALGVGPNTAIFSVIYATLYAPMPYPNAVQLVMLWSKIQGNRNGIAAGDFLDWQKQSTSFQGLWAWSGFSANLGGSETPSRYPVARRLPASSRAWAYRRSSAATSDWMRTNRARTTSLSSPTGYGSAASAAIVPSLAKASA